MMKLLKDEPRFTDIPHIVLRLPISSAKANRPIQALADRTAEWVVSESLQGKPGEGIDELNDLDLLNVYQTARG